MYLGIKSGPDDWQTKLDNDLNIRHVEIYFNLDWLDMYAPLWAWLREHGVATRLHSSTRLADGFVPNLVTQHNALSEASLALFRQTIDVAAGEGMDGIIVHPGTYQAQQIVPGRNLLVGDRTPPETGNRLVRDRLARLAEYGRQRGVHLLVENLSGRDLFSFEPFDRRQTVDPGALLHPVMRWLGEQGIDLCIDVGHLYSEMMVACADPDMSWAQTMKATKRLAPYTRHLHLSTIVPPFNGTDSHNGFLAEDVAQGAVPSLEQVANWLRLFEEQNVWAIPEPFGSADVHLQNYRVLHPVVSGLAKEWGRG
ncbi:MAG: sugar phosphate isomerase/epimerase [Anaerolineae bacterium]|nr:sugar phosphate isomerase/epimerase [Anaerolineae bacterium]